MAGRAGNRLFSPLQSFFKIPFTAAVTRPAVIKAKAGPRSALDWKDAVNTVFPKIFPLPRNSRHMENRIHNPHAMADSKSSSPYSPSVLPKRACLAQRRPVRNRMIHCPLVRVIPRAANPIRKAEAQTEPEAISTQSLRLHAGQPFPGDF